MSSLESNSKKQILERMTRGAYAMAFGQIVNIVIRITEVPILLKFWGLEKYGVWLVLSALPVYLMLFDGGFTSVSSREMTLKLNSGDKKAASAVFQSTSILLTTISIFFFIPLFFIIDLIDYKNFIDISYIGYKDIRYAILVLFFYVVVGFHTGLLYGVFCSEGKYSQGIFLITLSTIFEFLGLLIAVISGLGLVGAAFGYLLGRIFGWFILFIWAKKISRLAEYGFNKVSIAEIKRLFKPSLTSMFFPLGNSLNIQGIRILIGIAIGPAAVAIFSSIRTLCRTAVQPATMMTRLLEPEVAIAHGSGEFANIGKMYIRTTQLVLWSGVLIFVFLEIYGALVMRIWTGNKILLTEPLFSILLFTSLLNVLTGNSLVISYSINKHNKIAMLHLLFYGVLPLILTYCFIQKFNLLGTAFALLICEIVMNYFAIKNALILSDISMPSFLSGVLRPPLHIYKIILKKQLY